MAQPGNSNCTTEAWDPAFCGGLQIQPFARDDGLNVLLVNALLAECYFSLTTTNSGAQSKARLNSESGKMQMAVRAESA